MRAGLLWLREESDSLSLLNRIVLSSLARKPSTVEICHVDLLSRCQGSDDRRGQRQDVTAADLEVLSEGCLSLIGYPRSATVNGRTAHAFQVPSGKDLD
jgi:hypothetical protein